MRPSTLVSGLALFTRSSTASRLFVSSYSGAVTTVDAVKNADGNYTLRSVSETYGCSESPSWLTYDAAQSVVYCADEGLTSPNGTISSFKVTENGTLVQLDKITTITGPVNSVVFANGTNLAVAFYEGSALGVFDIRDPSNITPIQTDTFNLTQPGADPARQEAPHPHQTIRDPTDKFIIVPDLGADLVRVYHIEDSESPLNPVTPIESIAGAGPRHARFISTGNATYLYVVAELDNTVSGYKVIYHDNSTLGFELVYESGSFGRNRTVPVGAAAAEVHVSPDNNFLIISSRNDSTFTIPNFDPTNSTAIPSDTLINYAIDHATGSLTLLQTVPAGGSFPRDFSINNAGDLLVVGLQESASVVLIERDVATGLLGRFVGEIGIAGQVTCAIFQELGEDGVLLGG